ncbi:biosynthetic-type acetolactate synthase large subunit [Oleiharenicola lentus]|uniref:Acetolactate synthase n=1 Tax=Oleiharenicola lentus TaxID=2508720 RepID=A0A4Q1C9F1_9BACT|nr:biosynthetic-type acetolactate synthase large subunit [Oleiharenicola lentus]RXK55472.1 biosynthetic-type acetolactate synthase large subunit [Oleiharenicola lentus]
MKKLTGAEIVWECLQREGVDVVFGYPGGAILPTYDAMTKYPKIHHVLVRHEQGATHMADGYARASGKVGVAIATSGPGATNMVTGIATAMMDSSPIVCITGQVGSKAIGTDAFQETDVTGVTLPITKHNYLVTKPGDIARAIREAFYIAKSGRPGPVLVDITKDAQQLTADFDWDAAEPKLPGYRPNHTAPASEYTKAAELINSAKRPLILAGQGIIKSGATAEVLALAKQANIPITTTLLGIGAIPASSDLNLGMMGMHGEAWVNQAIQQADLLIALGMRFDDRVTGNLKTYALNAKKIHVEIDPTEVNKNVPVDVALIGDLKEVLGELTPQVKKSDHADWWAAIAVNRGDSAVRDIKNLPDSGHLYAAHVINDIWRLTQKRDTIVVTDVGQHQMWEAQYFHHDKPRSLITSGGLGTMGFALPAAIGAKFACPEKDVWVVVGDGGFQMTSCELATAEQEGIKVNVAIINNAFLGMVRQWQEFFYDKRYAATPMTGPDFVKLAEAYRLTGLRCNQRPDVAETVKKTLADKKTVVIDFVVEKEDTVFPMVPAGADLDKMIRRPKQDVMLESGSDKEWEMPTSPLPNVFTEKKVEAKALNGRGKAAPARKAAKPAKSNRR